jgi:hypothetical protein
VTWSRPATGRLLFEGGSVVVSGVLNVEQFAGSNADPHVLDSSRNYSYGSLSYGLGLNGALGYQTFRQVNQKFTTSYVTGSHSFKSGVQLMHGWRDTFFSMDPARNYTNYTFNGTTPTFVNYYAGPIGDNGRMRTWGVFAQDQWTIERLTLNLGARWDHLGGWVPAIDLPAGPWVPARSFPEVKDVPNWDDISPRLGAAYDVFGNGRTAVKGFIGRYVIFEPMAGVISQNSPVNLTVTSASRTWSDNGDYLPQENELGPLSNPNFGRTVQNTRFDPAVLTGNRPYNWQGSLQLQQQLWSGVALNVGYFRTWYGNFRATQSRAVTQQDYDQFCITAPVNPLLPGGGGNQICGLYDVVPSKFTVQNTDNLITLSRNFGDQSEVFNGVDVAMIARTRGGVFVQGGVASGSTVTDTCAMNERPNVLPQGGVAATLTPRTSAFCRVGTPWSAGTQLKAAVVYPLPWKFQASANYQNLPPIPTAANAAVANAAIAPILGRNLAACGTRVPCTSTVVADIVLPNTHFTEPRTHQLDVRVSGEFRLASTRIQPQIDLFNVTNSNSVLSTVTRLGPTWNNASAILAARVVRFGVNINF